MKLNINMPTLYEKQREAIFSPERYACIEASTKAGKTFGCLVWQATKVLRDKSKRNHWWVAPVYPQSRIAYERAKRMFDRRLWEKNDTEMRLDFVNGSRWFFKSGDNPDNLFGEDVVSAVIDEASRMKEESWYAIRTTLTYTRGDLRIIGNVKGRKNWAYRLARKAEAGEPGMSHHKLTAHDAIEGGVITADEVEDARRVLPDAVFRELYMAEPCDDQGNPFIMSAIRAQIAPVSEEKAIAFGVDLAKSQDWTVVLGLDASGRTSVIERWQSPWNETTQRIMGICGDVPTLVDSTGVGDPILERLQRSKPNFVGFKFTSSSKQQIMEGLANAIQSGDVFYPEGWIVNELESFEYEYTRTGVKYSAPVGLHDDGVCALALAVQHLRSGVPREIEVCLIGASDELDIDMDERQWTQL